MSEHSEHIEIQGPNGALEGFISMGAKKISFAIVLCHPHPVYGGDMDNNVVRAIYSALVTLGYTVVRFNFRGVGNSEGSYANGRGERDDTVAVCKFVLERFKSSGINSILIIGYSFGAAIGCSINAEVPALKGYIAVSYPFTFIPDFVAQAQIPKPKLFLMGSRDDFTSVQTFDQSFEAMPAPKIKVLIQHINHFWFGDEDLLLEHIRPWIEKLQG